MIIWQILMSGWAGVLIFYGGFILGKRNRIAPQTQIKICSCKHEYSFHDYQTGRCAKRHYENYTYHACRCQHYDGPVPPEDYLRNVSL